MNILLALDAEFVDKNWINKSKIKYSITSFDDYYLVQI